MQSLVSKTKKDSDLQSASQATAFGFSSGTNLAAAHYGELLGGLGLTESTLEGLEQLWGKSTEQPEVRGLCHCTSSEILELLDYPYIFKYFR